jgi:hypothetical protein
MTKLKINGLMNDEEIRWKKIKCCCSHIEGDAEHQHPIANCNHCKCQEQEDSMPRDNFIIQENDTEKDENGDTVTLETTHDKEVKEITIVRGQKLHDIIGWTF